MATVKPAPLVLFLGLAYGSMFATVLGTANGWFELPGPLYILLSVGSPTLAALAAAGIFEGSSGVKGILIQYGRVSVPWRWYAFGSLFFTVPLALGAVLASYTGRPAAPLAPEEVVTRVLMTLIVGPISEEGGWRGFATERLLRSWSPLMTSVVVGIFWGAWHLPFWFVEGSYQQQIPIAGFLVLSVFLSVIYTQVYRATGQSLPPVIALHFWFNLSGSMLVRGWAILSMAEFLTIEAALVLIASAVIMFGWLRSSAREEPQIS